MLQTFAKLHDFLALFFTEDSQTKSHLLGTQKKKDKISSNKSTKPDYFHLRVLK